MGWNSFDAYDSRITEAEFKENVDYIVEHLEDYGWNYAVVDFLWFNPEPGAWPNPKRRFGHADLRLDKDGVPIDKLAVDTFGRPQPAVERFPSAGQGRGFKQLADYVHQRGMKFGIHMMRGIPRQAYFDANPILGTAYTAKDIANTKSSCPWNNNMFGVDPNKPGAREYYESVIDQYAEWGVDFIKLDDALSPTYHKEEIELIRDAIAQSGRPMVLSLSPGPASLEDAESLKRQADMWRVSKDFWDDWKQLKAMFPKLAAWANQSGPGNWPDADMLPIGRLSLGGRPRGPERDSRFSITEMKTMLSLWAVARSPLMIGGALPSTKPEVISLLKNPELIRLNQQSATSRQVSAVEGRICWVASDSISTESYLVLFNISEQAQMVRCSFADAGLTGPLRIRDVWNRRFLELRSEAREVSQQLPAHGSAIFRLSAPTPNNLTAVEKH